MRRGGRGCKGRKVFFSEEKKQKTLFFGVYASQATYAEVQKFFGSFFQKRTRFVRASRRMVSSVSISMASFVCGRDRSAAGDAHAV
jgi:hypothetical protein